MEVCEHPVAEEQFLRNRDRCTADEEFGRRVQAKRNHERRLPYRRDSFPAAQDPAPIPAIKT